MLDVTLVISFVEGLLLGGLLAYFRGGEGTSYLGQARDFIVNLLRKVTRK